MGKIKKRDRHYFFVKGHEFEGNQFVYKTKFKRKTSLTLRNSSFSKQGIKRLNELDFKRITKESQDGRSYRMIGGSGEYMMMPGIDTMLLRPKKSGHVAVCREYLNKDNSYQNREMRVINNDKLTLMWNTCIKDHNNNTLCKDISLHTIKEVKQGICWEQTLGCKNCTYQSMSFKLYDEVKTFNR